MTPEELSREQLGLTGYIIDQVCERALGRVDAECLFNHPHDVYFIGNLRSRDMANANAGAGPAHLPELINKLAPVAFGGEFKLVPADGTAIEVDLSWSCYYRLFPTYDQQVAHQQGLQLRRTADARNRPDLARPIANQDDDDDDADPASENEAAPSEGTDVDVVAPQAAQAQGHAAAGGGRGRRDTLMIRFRKIECCARGRIALSQTNEGWRADTTHLEQSIHDEVERARAVSRNDLDAVKHSGDPHAPIHVPDAALVSAQAYDQFLRTLTNAVNNDWNWQIRVETKPDVNDRLCIDLSVIFANETPRQLSPRGKDNLLIDAFLFDTRARYVFQNCEVRPFNVNLAPEGFRYDRHIDAHGFNCSVGRVGQAFVTSHVPRFDQQRYQTRTTPPAEFEALVRDPLLVLDTILEAMEEYRGEWARARDMFLATVPHWQEKHAAEFDRDQQIYNEEVAAFKRGRDLIRDNEDVKLAFRLTNETFRRGPKKTGWRLFQIVFLVSQIPGLCALTDVPGSSQSDLETVDIVYFPTGGGKTEAYLGVLVFHCFFDRLRGKTAGVTSWIRFPLRLLTLQQTQRVADTICVADIVRREQLDPRLSSTRVAGFGVGYFVGKTSTPNELVNVERYQFANPEQRALWDKARDPRARQDWRRLIYCPSCRSKTVRIDLDEAQTRINHVCSNSACKFLNGRIPVYVIDNEIYRYLPSVLVGTIDKLASVGNQRKMVQVFGDVDGFCTVHGFFKGNKCCQRDCDNSHLNRTPPSGISGPTLFIQDELHLLKEGLGTFDGHYETFLREVMSEIRPGAQSKIIASSATIEKFERQVEHLYAVSPLRARRFPGQGPTLGQSFYAETLDFPQRRYVGLMPHNKTIFNSILELLEYYHRVVQGLLDWAAGAPNPYGGVLQPGTPDWARMLDLFVTSTSYFLSGRDMNSVRTDLDSHVNALLEGSGLSPLHLVELTGSTSTDEVAQSLEYLEEPKAGRERSTAVLATQMISHGVDIDRFNAMFFYGMPRQNAEYIQASSRVGRTNMGIVFVCHHPARERDQSHYALFAKYHQYLGQLVEPVAINRWAKFSINRTLPGLFMGVLLQLISNRNPSSNNNANPNLYYMTDHVRREISSGRLRPADFIAILEKAYDVVNPTDAARAGFRDEIALRVPQFFDQILQAAPSKKFVSSTLIPAPMNSLRSVDEPITVSLDRDGSNWAARGGS